MTPALVLDTSVVIKWFHQEEILAGRALALRSSFLDGRIRIAAPTLLAYELANVLGSKGDLTAENVQEAVQSLFDMDLDWEPPTPGLLRRAVAVARDLDLSVYEGSFAALAEAIGAQFVTADERLARRLAALPFVSYLGEM